MSTQENKNAVIYCRVSTKEQVEEGNSLITQEKHCRDFSNKHNYEIVRVFIEQGESAKTADRTELQNLLKFCAIKKNNVQVVVIYKIDRLSRNIDDYSQLRLQLKKYGVEIKSTSEYFENTPAGRFMENIIANVAQFDNDVRTERSIGGMRQAVLEGRYVWPAPTGYTNTKINGKANIVLSSKALLVQKAYEKVAGGTSINEVRVSMAKEGLCSKDGKPLAKSLFYRMLKNEVYTGVIDKLGERVQGSYEPLINEELFRIVQRRIKSKKKERQYVIENPDFPLRRFVVSPDGEKLTGCWSQGKTKKYPYYRFIRLNKLYGKECLESQFSAFLNQLSFPQVYYTHLKENLKQHISESSKHLQASSMQWQEKEKQLNAKKQKLIDKCLSGTISDTILKQQLDLVEDELLIIYQKKTAFKTPLADSPSLIEQFSELLLTPGDYWMKQPFEVKKKLLKFEFPKGIIFNGTEFQTREICSVFKLKNYFEQCEFCKVNYPRPSYRHPKSAKDSLLKNKEFIVLWSEVQRELTELHNSLAKIESRNTSLSTDKPKNDIQPP